MMQLDGERLFQMRVSTSASKAVGRLQQIFCSSASYSSVANSPTTIPSATQFSRAVVVDVSAFRKSTK
jgi:hypothetical protein